MNRHHETSSEGGQGSTSRRGLAKTRGDAGELAVASYLQTRGFQLLAHQYMIPRLGEIDLVMRKNNCLYFIEVKARSENHSFGSGLEHITQAKIQKVRKAALAYCQNTNNMNNEMRILAAEVVLTDGKPSGNIRIVPM